MQALIDNLSGPVDELRNQSINATTDVLLVGDRLVCRVEECTMGNVIADGLRAETGAQIAIMNGGGIRANMEAGDITLGDVLTVQPFGNTIATLSLTGADVIAALENGVSRITVENGQVVRQGANGSGRAAGGQWALPAGLWHPLQLRSDPGSRQPDC